MECPQTEAYGHVTAEPSSGIPRTAADTWHRELGPRYTINPRGTPDTSEPSERETCGKQEKGRRASALRSFSSYVALVRTSAFFSRDTQANIVFRCDTVSR